MGRELCSFRTCVSLMCGECYIVSGSVSLADVWGDGRACFCFLDACGFMISKYTHWQHNGGTGCGSVCGGSEAGGIV